jgi:hypothetical protein
VSVKKIGKDAFNECSSLSDISLPVSLTLIGEDAFAKCTSLTSLVVPVAVNEIDDDAFSGCSALSQVELPVGLKKLGSSAFEKCVSLLAVQMNSPLPPKTSKSAFRGVSGACKLYVPRGSSSTYRADKVWGAMFSQIQEGQISALPVVNL